MPIYAQCRHPIPVLLPSPIAGRSSPPSPLSVLLERLPPGYLLQQQLNHRFRPHRFVYQFGTVSLDDLWVVFASVPIAHPSLDATPFTFLIGSTRRAGPFLDCLADHWRGGLQRLLWEGGGAARVCFEGKRCGCERAMSVCRAGFVRFVRIFNLRLGV